MSTDTPTSGNDAAGGDPSVARIRITTLGTIAAMTLLALVAAMVTTRSAAGSAFVLGVGLTAGGFVIGLLFSVPRAFAVAGDITQPLTRSVDSNEAGDSVQTRPLYALNTNLEQVSDWLTKIIVGVGLVEAQHLTTFVWNAAVTLGGQFNQSEPSLDADGATTLAVGMLISFPLLGFLLGFLSIRLYISRAMRAADEDVLKPMPVRLQAKTVREIDRVYGGFVSQASNAGSLATSVPQEEVDAPAVDAALQAPLDRLRSPQDLIARGRAAFLKGKPEEAVEAFERALKVGGESPEVLLDYARALMRMKPTDWNKVVAHLEKARRLMDSVTPLDVRKQILWELLNAYLYLPKPTGFTSAIALVKDYESEDLRDDVYSYVYLSAAHGQAYEYWMATGQPELAKQQLDMLKDALAHAVSLADTQGMGKAIRSWLLALTNPSVFDNDLAKAFADNPDLGRLIEPAKEEQQ